MTTAVLPGISARFVSFCLRAFRLFITCMFMHGSLRHDDVNDVISDTDGACKGRYGCKPGLICAHMRADMGLLERVVMGLESRAVSALVIKHFVTIFSKTCNKSGFARA